MHMKPATLKVHVNQTVTRGQEMGFVSNYFPPGGTTVHLHLEILQPVTDGAHAYTNVPPYTSLVDAYQRLLSGQDH